VSKYHNLKDKDPLFSLRTPGLTSLYRTLKAVGLGGIAERLARTLTPYVLGSGMRVSPKGYASLVVLLSLLSPPTFFAIGYLIKGLVLAVSLAILSVVVPGITYMYPMLKYRNRGDMLDVKILNLEAALATSLIASASHEEAFINLLPIADVLGFDVELREVTKALIHDRLPLSDALIKVAQITPSRSASLLFEGLKGIIESGAGILEYIYWMASSSYNDVESKYRAAFNSLSILMEVYMALAVLLPIVTIAAIVALFGVGGFVRLPMNPKYLASLVSFVLTPLLALGTLIIADSIVSRLRP
jgi:archaellum biogenesis protein FlaJ (TadC family)